MKRIPCLHNTTPYEVILTIESRMDKSGNIYYFSDDLQTRFAYQSVIDPTNSYDFHILKERSRLNVRNSSKTKRKNEFLMEGTKFRDYIFEFDRKLKENGI